MMNDDDAHDEEMARRVKIVGGVTLGVGLTLIALSALTLKADQVNLLPRAPIGPQHEVPVEIVEPDESADN